MDKKTLTALSVQFAYQQLQINALFLLIQAHHPIDEVRKQYSRFMDDGVEIAGVEITKKIREGIRNGVVLQQMKNMGVGHLWDSRDSPDSSDEQT